jgi:hypothetical protein
MGHQKCGPKGHEVIEVEGTWKSLIPYWSEEILESRCLQNAIFCGPFRADPLETQTQAKAGLCFLSWPFRPRRCPLSLR